MEMSRFLYEVGFFFARAQFVKLAVRFLAKIPNGTAAESPCYIVFWNAIDFCRLYLNTIELAMCVGVCVSHVLDSQLLNG